jgi:hypothetical protein
MNVLPTTAPMDPAMGGAPQVIWNSIGELESSLFSNRLWSTLSTLSSTVV